MVSNNHPVYIKSINRVSCIGKKFHFIRNLVLDVMIDCNLSQRKQKQLFRQTNFVDLFALQK